MGGWEHVGGARQFLTPRPMRVKNIPHVRLPLAPVLVPVPRGTFMIESTKPVTDTDDEPEILARYTKVLPKGRCSEGYELKSDLSVEVEQTPEGWGATVEVECLYQFGWGTTEEEAMNELVYILGDVRLSLRKFKGELDPCSNRCLELLEEMLA